MRGPVEALVLEVRHEPDGSMIVLQLPADPIRLVLPIALPSPGGRGLDPGAIVVLDGDALGATTARFEGRPISRRDYRTRRAWRAVRPRAR